MKQRELDLRLGLPERVADLAYESWRRRHGAAGILITTGRPALPPTPQKAKTQRRPDAGSSVPNPINGGSNHGISKV